MSTCELFHRSSQWFVLLLIIAVTATVRANQEYDYGPEDYGKDDGQDDYYDIGQLHKKVNLPPAAKTNYYEQLGRLVAHKKAQQMVKAYHAKSGDDFGSQASAPSSMAPAIESSTLSTESTTAAASTNVSKSEVTAEVTAATAESTSSTVNSSSTNPSNSSSMSPETPTTSSTTVPATSSLVSNESTQSEQGDDNADGGANHGLLWLLLVLVGVCTCATAANFCPIPTLPGGKRKSTGADGSSSKGTDTEKGTTGEQSRRLCLLSQYTSGQNTGDKKVTPQTSTPVTPNHSNKASSSSTGTSITSSSGQSTDSSKKSQNTSKDSSKVATDVPVATPKSAESHKHSPVLSQFTGTKPYSAAPVGTKYSVGTQNGGGSNEKPAATLAVSSAAAGASAATGSTNTPSKH